MQVLKMGINIEKGILQDVFHMLSISLLSWVNGTSGYSGYKHSRHVILCLEDNKI